MRYIDTAIELEKKGLAFYKSAFVKVKDANSKGLLRFLINEEEEHLAYFKALKKGEEKKPNATRKESIPLFNKQAYSKMKKDRSEVIGIFTTALQMELDGITFYSNLLKKEKDVKAKSFLKTLIAMEKRHYKLIKQHQDAIYNYWYWEAIDQPRLET